jgi:hypothetical protein
MKAFLISLALVTPAFAVTPETFEVDSQGCMFSTTHASCIVTNKLQWDVTCSLSIETKTKAGTMIGNTRRVLIPAKRFQLIEAFSGEENPIISASASGICTVEQ